MKKLVVGMFVAAIVASSAIAGITGQVQSKAAGQGSSYADYDGNGICDNVTERVCDGSGAGKIKEAVATVVGSVESKACTSGVTTETVVKPAVCEAGTAKSGNYADGDGDGICDRYESGLCGGGVCDGTGAQGYRYGQGNGVGCRGGRNR